MKKRWKATLCIDPHGAVNVIAANATNFKSFVRDNAIDKVVAVTIEKWKPTTSNPQFRYYYGVVLELIAKETGMDKESLDSILKSKFLYEYTMLGDSLEKCTISKTRVTTTQFNEFLNQVVCWAAEFLGLVIPEPNEAEPIGVDIQQRKHNMEHNLTGSDLEEADKDLEAIQWDLFTKSLDEQAVETQQMLLTNGYLD